MSISLQSRRLALPESNLQALKQGALDLAEHSERLLDYPSSRGDDDLRMDIKRITPNWQGDVLVTESATSALSLSLALIGKGKKIAVQVPAYFMLFDQVNSCKQELQTWETLDELRALGAVDAIITTSNHRPPSSVSLTTIEKQQIADLARKHQAWVIEDNAYEPLWFNQEPTPIPADTDRSIRIGSLSKFVAPALRLGFIRANDEILNAIRARQITDKLSVNLPSQIMARPSLEAEVLDNWKKTLHQRADHLRTGLTAKTRSSIPEPDGGSYLRFDLPAQCDPETFAQIVAAKGLLVDPNAHQYPDKQARPYIRLHCGAIDSKDIPQAIDIISESIK